MLLELVPQVAAFGRQVIVVAGQHQHMALELTQDGRHPFVVFHRDGGDPVIQVACNDQEAAALPVAGGHCVFQGLEPGGREPFRQLGRLFLVAASQMDVACQ